MTFKFLFVEKQKGRDHAPGAATQGDRPKNSQFQTSLFSPWVINYNKNNLVKVTNCQ